MTKFDIAVVGATGNVGRKIIQLLSERNFPVNNIYAIASQKSLGKKISFGENKEINVENLEAFDFTKSNLVFMCAGSEITKTYVPNIRKSGAIVIDKSSYYRMDSDVPLLVPEVNSHILNKKEHNLIASPNCIAIPLTVVLKPLDNMVKIRRVIVSTYQSVSGCGKNAMDELYEQTKDKYSFKSSTPKSFQKPIAFNVIPQIGALDKDLVSLEEKKIIEEFIKIMERNIFINVTAVRVPTFIGHAMSVNIEFEDNISLSDARDIMYHADSVTLDEINITPTEISGKDSVFVSRIRFDHSKENSLNCWIVTDNLLKGAALNAVQIAENLL